MSDFPRGWTLSSGFVVTASITVPAIAGVVHVLDSFTVEAEAAGAMNTLLQLSSSDGVFASFVLAWLNLPAGVAETASGSGLDLAAGPGASLTIGLSAAPANSLLVIQGHDI